MPEQNIDEFAQRQNREFAKLFVQANWPEDATAYAEQGITSLETWKQSELETHVVRRYREFSDTVVPWLNEAVPLSTARVLEVGAGTGAATLALASTGAQVTGIDISAGSLALNRARLEIWDKSAELLEMNAIKMSDLNEQFDLIVFFANYEHLTHTERAGALKAAWSLLSKGGKIAIVECPNRLWYYDVHTTLINFWHWLPDQMARDYARLRGSPNLENLSEMFESNGDLTSLARSGRAASYHDLEIFIGPLEEMTFSEGLMDFRRRLDPDLNAWWQQSLDGRYRELLMNFAPEMPSAFFYPWFDVIFGPKRA